MALPAIFIGFAARASYSTIVDMIAFAGASAGLAYKLSQQNADTFQEFVRDWQFSLNSGEVVQKTERSLSSDSVAINNGFVQNLNSQYTNNSNVLESLPIVPVSEAALRSYNAAYKPIQAELNTLNNSLNNIDYSANPDVVVQQVQML
jgi:hypothetical protein